MNRITFTIVVFAFCFAACSTPEPTELKIQENDECMLNNPSQIAMANDSAICIIDRTRAYQVDTRSGMINSIGFEEVSHSFAEFLSKISGQPLTDSTPIQPLALLGYGDSNNNALYACPLPVMDTMGYSIIPASVFHNGKDFKILFDDKGGIASNVPQGNFQYFLSDSIIITNSASQYERSQTPDNIPSLMLFVKQKSGEFVLQKTIDLPRRESENMAAEGNVMNPIYTYVSQPQFCALGGKVYASMAGSVFEIAKDGTATKITESSRSIYAFMVDDKAITTVEGSEDNFSKIVKYNLDGEQKDETDLPISAECKCKCCKFIDGKLYMIYLKGQNFFLATI
ncbi:MAG: hypothetical protein J5709_03420 [Bacteroidales bacterium]|nr:hypothetical protein [Bacteroidales bacterium]